MPNDLLNYLFAQNKTMLCDKYVGEMAIIKNDMLIRVVCHGFQITFGQCRGSPDTSEKDTPDTLRNLLHSLVFVYNSSM